MNFKRIALYSLLLVLMLGSLNSCRILRPTEMLQVEDDYPLSEFKPSEKEYKIKAFDKLRIQITTNKGHRLVEDRQAGGGGNASYYSRQRGREYLVEYDGLVKLPTLGRVQISGMTIREAEAFLEKQYAEYYQEPFVLIEVSNRKVLIFESGGTSGTVVDIPSENLTLIEALAKSGGLTDMSKSYRIRLIRGNLTENPEVYYYDISHLTDLQGTNILLEANDIIYIESRPRYLSRVLNEISPYLTLLTTMLTVYGIFFTL